MLNKELKDAQFKRAFMKAAMDNLEQDLQSIEHEIEDLMNQIMKMQSTTCTNE